MPIVASLTSDGFIKLAYNFLASEKENAINIEIEYDEDVALKKFKRFVNQARIPGVELFKYDKYICKDVDTMVAAFNDFIDDETFYFNSVELDIAEMKYMENKTPHNCNKLFTMQMSQKYQAFLPSDLPMKFSFEDADRYDLVDPYNHIVFKCKYSKTKVYMGKEFRWCEENVPEDYTLRLIINEGAEVAKTVTLEYVLEPLVEIESEEIPREDIDTAIAEMETITRQLIKDNEFDMRIQLCKDNEHDMLYGKNHISQFHVLTNRTRERLDENRLSRYFEHALHLHPLAKKLYDALY